VPDGAVAAITAEGAAVVRTPGYDQSVAAAADYARAGAGLLIQDTWLPGNERVLAWIVDGYSTMFTELVDQLPDGRLDLLAIPVGVGSLAQSAITYFRGPAGSTTAPGSTPAPAAASPTASTTAPAPTTAPASTTAPALLAVEPQHAPCVAASLLLGEVSSVPTRSTIMAGLNCGTPSRTAWPFLRAGLDAVVTVSDAEAAKAVGDLARHGVAAGPCGAATLAGVRAALTGQDAADRRRHLGLTAASTLVLLSTEGAAANSGRHPENVEESRG
jgi:diaminopropionate ammonia-lyase